MFLAELRRLAGPYNCGQFVTQALRDRFIAGINDEHIQGKILSVPGGDLTLIVPSRLQNLTKQHAGV